MKSIDILRRATSRVAAVTCMMAAATGLALAVEINPNGHGQVLLYPYYNAITDAMGAQFATLISVTNTTDHVKAVRVRFREGQQGNPVGEFNLYLDRYDSWAGAVLPNGTGAGFASFDTSCTAPPVSSLAAAPTVLGNGTANAREGYIEVFELGDYGPVADAAPGSVAAAIRHVTYPNPVNCARVATDTGSEAGVGTGGLVGGATLISVLRGLEFTYPAVALSGFNESRSLFAAPGVSSPTLVDAEPAVSIVWDDALGTVRTQWARGIDAVSAVLMRRSLTNDFLLESFTWSTTDWIVTLPTKWHYVRAGVTASQPFGSTYGEQGACELLPTERNPGLIFDREGTGTGVPVDFIPSPQQAKSRGLCWAANSIGFNGLWIFNSANRYAASGSEDGSNMLPGRISTTFSSGWSTLDLDGGARVAPELASLFTHRLIGGATTIFKRDGTVETRPQATYRGLPVIGFGATTRSNGTLLVDGNAVLSNFGSANPHRYTSVIE